MIYLTGDMRSLADSNQWKMSSTNLMADWYVFYSTMDGRGFWGAGSFEARCRAISALDSPYDEYLLPF